MNSYAALGLLCWFLRRYAEFAMYSSVALSGLCSVMYSYEQL